MLGHDGLLLCSSNDPKMWLSLSYLPTPLCSVSLLLCPGLGGCHVISWRLQAL